MDFNSGPRRVLRPAKASGAAATESSPAKVPSPFAAAALEKALQEQLRLPKYRSVAATVDASRMAEAMLACINSPDLDFTSLSHSDAALLATLPAQTIWPLLEDQARAQPNGEITSVTLSPILSTALVANPAQTLVDGLGHLPGLTHLTIVDPPTGSIDLARSGATLPGLANVQIKCLGPPRRWELHVPYGAEVFATADSVSLEKSVVFYWDHDGQHGEPRTLGGIIHDSQPRNWTLPQMPREIELNGVVEFRGSRDTNPEDRKIWCRHLALHWLRAREENASRAAPFDYASFTRKELVSAAVKPDLEKDFAALVSASTDALFGPDQFGELLAQQFAGMQTGQTRRFIVNTPNHALALELRLKTSGDENKGGAPLEYVVTVYDPNRTAMHERLMVPNLDLLRTRGLGAWLPVGAIDDYFPTEQGPPIASLHSLREAGDAKHKVPDRDFLRHVPAGHRVSPMVLHWAMLDDRPQVVGEILDIALGLLRSGEVGRAEVMQCIAANNATASGLAAALVFGRPAVVGRYLKGILDDSSQIISSSERIDLLRSPCQDDQPGLHLTASEEAAKERAAMVAEAISVYVRAIVASPHLEAQDKASLCAAAHQGSTAAQAALANKNPTMAAAMVCAICEAENDPRARTDLLAGLGVNPREVLDAQTGTDDPRLARFVDILEGGTQPR